MKTAADLVRGWLAKADSDLAEARRCAASEGPYDTGCFHCQQAVEKYIKSVLCLHGRVPTRTHDIGQLVAELMPLQPKLKLDRPEVLALTDYAVALRYDSDFWPSQADVAGALAVAGQVRARCWRSFQGRCTTHNYTGLRFKNRLVLRRIGTGCRRANRKPTGKTLAQGLLRFAGVIKGLPSDLAANHDHYLHGRPRR
jgi:HEPN domain-containing protein